MQELRFVAVSEDGSYAILAVPGRSGRYVLPIDERLRAIANGQTSRLAQYEIEVESPLRPKEIQARIRAGETAEEIADAAGIPVERVRWFEGPVLAERAYIADQAQTASVRRAGDSAPGPRLGEIVPARLTASGADPEDAQWDSRKRGDGNWQVTLSFPSAGRVHLAEWVFDPRRRHVMPDDDNAARLSLPESELPSEPVSMPGEATVTPLAPRLGAAAGMGGGGIGGPGGFASGASGVGVRSFRPERSVIPDRSLSADRTLADRTLADRSLADRSLGAERAPVIPRPGQDHTVHHDSTGFRDPAPARDAPYRDAPYREPAAYREPMPELTPEPAPYFDSTPEPAARRAPEPAPYREPAREAAPREPVQEIQSHRAPVLEPPVQPRPVVFEEPEPLLVDDVPAVVPDAPEPDPAPEPVLVLPKPEPVVIADPVSEPARAAAPVSTRPEAPEPETEPETTARFEPAVVPEPEPDPAAVVAEPEPVPAPIVTPAATSTPAPTPVPSPATIAAQHAAARQPAPVTPVTKAEPASVPATSRPAAAPERATAQPESATTATTATSVPEAAAPENTPGAIATPAAAAPEAPAAAAEIPAVVPEAPAAAEVPAAEAPAAAEVPAAPEAAEPVPAQPAAEAAPEPGADDQSGRPRAGSKKNAKGRRSSVPSWDEIMLGSSRQRD